LFEIFAAGAESEREPALILSEFAERGDLVDQLIIELDGSSGVDIHLGRRLAVLIADVRRHLEVGALALVIDFALLNVLVGERVGLRGVELDVGGSGTEVGGGHIEAVEGVVQVVSLSMGDRAGEENQGDEHGKDWLDSWSHDLLIRLDARLGADEAKKKWSYRWAQTFHARFP